MARSAKPRKGAAGAALAVVILGLLAFCVARPSVLPSGLARDFNAFYCAGRALSDRADPYRMEPLGRCEREAKPAPLLTGLPGLVMPAPLPPYALLPFVALARLPYVAAAMIWAACLLLSVAVAVVATKRATGIATLPLVAAFALTDGYASVCLGQVAPIAVAAIAMAALLLKERKDELAALAASFAMIEPHVGLPACLAMFAWRGRTRLPLLSAGACCALVSFMLAGVATSLEYVRFVLPAHALSEVANEKQLSLTYVLHLAGVNDALAVRAGEWSYLAMLILGVVVARALAEGTNDNSAIAALPPALVLIGGPFVHITQIPVALPAAFLLYSHASVPQRRVLGLAIVGLAVPWIQFLNLGLIFPFLVALVCAILIATLVERTPAIVAGGAVVAFYFVASSIASIAATIPNVTPTLLAHYDPKALAEASWTLYVRTLETLNSRSFDDAKIPTLLGLVTIAYVAMTQTFIFARGTPLQTLTAKRLAPSGAAFRTADARPRADASL